MQRMLQPDTTSDEYRTADLGVAAYVLVAHGAPLLRVEWDGPRAFFVFPAVTEAAARLFYQPGRNAVDARAFHMALRELRGLTRREERRW
jgi:hypothetical protein